MEGVEQLLQIVMQDVGNPIPLLLFGEDKFGGQLTGLGGAGFDPFNQLYIERVQVGVAEAEP